jgi:hypothetical protein
VTVTFADAETLVKAWLATTPVAPLVTRPDAGLSIFLAMPTSAPLPAVVLSRVGGAPRAAKDIPEDAARISMHCWAKTRTAASAMASKVVAACESLARDGRYTSGTSHLVAATVISVVWLPDPEADLPRYVVDALFTVVTD